MGMIINIAEALKNRHDYNMLREGMNDMLVAQQEAFEKSNPIDLLFTRGTLSSFQTTYTSSIGFVNAFAETGDYGVAPIFNTHEGFSQVYTSRTFQGGFLITKQVLEDEAFPMAKNTASQFMTRWQGDTVEYAMTAISAGFGVTKIFGDESNGGESQLLMNSADTADGNTMNPLKNPLFSNNHTIVKRKGMSVADVKSACQSNSFYVTDGIALGGSDPGQIAKLADTINQVITTMENYKNDNNKYAGVQGRKRIVAPNDARLVAALNSAIDMPTFNDFGQNLGPNPSYKIADIEKTPYLRDLSMCYDKSASQGIGFFIVDPTYNEQNQGPEFTERVPLTLNVDESKNPYGISYDARQRFDVNVSSWKGIAFVYIGASAPTVSTYFLADNGTTTPVTGFSAMTAITPVSTLAQPVTVTNAADFDFTAPTEG